MSYDNTKYLCLMHETQIELLSLLTLEHLIIAKLQHWNVHTTCLTFFEREMGSGASPGVSAKPGWSVWLVVWKTGSAWRRSGRSPSGSGTST